MKHDSLPAFMVRMALAVLVIFFISCPGCIQASPPPQPAALPVAAPGEIPDRTQDVSQAATVSLPSPLTTGISPEGSAQSTGSLVIWSSPPACSVYIDGRYAGDTPPVRGSFTRVLPGGPHTVRITKIGFVDHMQDVYVPDGKSLTVIATLSEKTFPYYTLNRTSAVTVSYS